MVTPRAMTKFKVFRGCVSAFVLVAGSNFCLAGEMSADAKARLIGGLQPRSEDMSDSDVQRIVMSNDWRTAPGRAAQLTTWGSGRGLFAAGKTADLQKFLGTELKSVQGYTKNLLYLFGGADILYPHIFFPNLERVLMVGLESPGQLLDPKILAAKGKLRSKMSEVAVAFRDIARLSYFITSHMSAELREFGTSTMMAVGLVSNGFKILNWTAVNLDSRGELSIESRGGLPGMRIQFVKPNGQVGEIVYLQMDLSNTNLARHPELASYVRTQKFDTAFYKAASFVSHGSQFTQLNQLVLNQVNVVVQSDDGIPFRTLREQAKNWNLRLYGYYSNPHHQFGIGPQRDLCSVFDRSIKVNGTRKDLASWTQLWGGRCGTQSNLDFASVGWRGTIPVCLGYAAGLSSREQLGTLMVLTRQSLPAPIRSTQFK